MLGIVQMGNIRVGIVRVDNIRVGNDQIFAYSHALTLCRLHYFPWKIIEDIRNTG